MTISSYCSIPYLAVFLPAVLVLYGVSPKKARPFILLFSSYGFFWLISGKLLVYLLLSTFSIHHTGIWLALTFTEQREQMELAAKEDRKTIRAVFFKKRSRILAFAVCMHIGILVILKYSAFLGGNINTLFSSLHIPLTLSVPSYTAPIGLSFFTLQAVSYLFDVYREKIPADRNLGRLALYMAFFPQIMEGPICRYSNTAARLWQGEPLSFQNLNSGLSRILFGMLKKIVIADRLNSLIQNVFNNYTAYDGGIIAAAAILYTCQLYMEFSGTMDMVIGSGQLFGIALPENFRQPFFSRSISEFWMRWHITLGTWFKDYIFYPLSMSKPLKKLTSRARKRLGNHFGPLLSGSIALFTVWFLNGLWHGAGWHYLFFGMYHFALILTGNIAGHFSERLTKPFPALKNSLPWKGMQIIRTGILVCIGELFFRANGLYAGLAMFKTMITGFTLESFQNGAIFGLGMDKADFFILFVAVIAVLITSIFKERGISLRTKLAESPAFVRWAIYYSLILFVVIFGAYGAGYIPVDPIYANF